MTKHQDIYRLISVHVPKTAGSSLHSQFSHVFGEKLALDVSHDPFTVAGQEKASFPRGKKALHGHFAARRYETEHAFWLTFLRNPIDNLISIYFYWRSIETPAQHLHEKFLKEKPTITDLARYRGLQRLFSETYFGGFDMQRFNFVGFHENRAKDIARLGKLLDLPLESGVHVNSSFVSEERLSMSNSPRIRKELESILSEDIKFYDRNFRRHSI